MSEAEMQREWRMNVIRWSYKLTAATILGVSHSISPMVVSPETFNIHEGLKKLLTIILVSGLLGAFTFLAKSPLPKLPKELNENDTDVV